MIGKETVSAHVRGQKEKYKRYIVKKSTKEVCKGPLLVHEQWLGEAQIAL
jgi:hypothetical protein